MASLISIQINGKASVKQNLAAIEQLIEKACLKADLDRLVVIPECASIFGCTGKEMLAAGEIIENGPIQAAFSDMAKRFQCYLIAGSTPIISANSADKYTATSLAYNPLGKPIARYNKIHLFDVDVADKTASYRESTYTEAGDAVCVFDAGFATVGMSICYDIRFAGMFDAMRDDSGQAPSILVVPSAFTKKTGEAHWHALLQARSIENQCFVVASNQTGIHADGRETFGNSCIYSPWGECLSLVENGEGFAIAPFDVKQIQEIRQKMPIHLHKKERYSIER